MGRPQRPEVVVVTGAPGGIGRVTVQAFAKRGAHIGLVARGRAGLEGALCDVERLGGKGSVIPTEVADPDAVEAAAQQVEDSLGPLDIWLTLRTGYIPAGSQATLAAPRYVSA